MARFNNWIADLNKYNLMTPPAWWLQKLYDQDAALVVFPSRLRQAYVLARRRQFSRSLHVQCNSNQEIVRQSRGGDSDVMATHGLIFIDFMVNTQGNFTDAVFGQLRARDGWAAGGGEAMDRKIFDAESAEEGRKRKTMIDNIDHRARDAYRSYKARTGQRTKVSNGNLRPQAKQMPVASFGPSEPSRGAIFTTD